MSDTPAEALDVALLREASQALHAIGSRWTENEREGWRMDLWALRDRIDARLSPHNRVADHE